MTLLEPGSSWRDEAECVGITDLMYDTKRVDAARRVCRRCPVRFECVIEAHARGETYGVWGGTNFGDPGERRARSDDHAAA